MGNINKFELLGFDSINDVYRMLNNYTCNGTSCFSYIRDTYCDNWSNTEAICTQLQTVEQNNSSNGFDDVTFDEVNLLDCDELFGEESEELKDLIKIIYNLVKILIPLIIIGFSVLDFAKAVLSGSEDNMKKTTQRFIKRILVAVAIFLVPALLKVILTISYNIWGILSPDFCGIL